MVKADIEAPSIWLIGSNNKSLPGKADKGYNSASEQWAIAKREQGLLWWTISVFTAAWCFPLYLGYLSGSKMVDIGYPVMAGYTFSIALYLAYRRLLKWSGGWEIDKDGGNFTKIGKWYLPDGTVVMDKDLRKSNRFSGGLGTQSWVVMNPKKYGFDRHNGIFITKTVFDKARGEGMKVMPLGKYYEKTFSKTLAPDTKLTELGSGGGDTASLIVKGGWVVFYIQITLGTIAAQLGYGVFKEVLPWLMMSTFLAGGFLTFWWTTYTWTSIARTVQMKTKALLLAVSFSLTSSLILLGRVPSIVS